MYVHSNCSLVNVYQGVKTAAYLDMSRKLAAEILGQNQFEEVKGFAQKEPWISGRRT